MTPTNNWRRRAAAKVARMTKAQALAALAEIDANERSFDNPAIRALCGNSSQSINFEVKRILGRKAGFCI